MQLLINQYDFNLSYAKALVADLTEMQMTFSPGPGFENHPAFTLGHLVAASAMVVEDLGGKFEMPDGWKELFMRKGPGDPARPDPAKEKYPVKEALLEELQHQHNKVKELLIALSVERKKEKVSWRFSKYMPSLIDSVIFMCINHEAMHLGQLSAWRRALSLSSALNKL